jgi:uncharacterized protein YqgC (DUF456 family)
MLVGLLGLIVPIFPGLVIIWLAALAFVLIKISAMTTLGWFLFGIITILAIAGSLADNVLMGAKALEYGASKRSIILTLVIAIAVSIFLSPIGGLISAPLSLFWLERRWLSRRCFSPYRNQQVAKNYCTLWFRYAFRSAQSYSTTFKNSAARMMSLIYEINHAPSCLPTSLRPTSPA